ncbi:MAG: flagellar biosynthetic protein FliO [Novosphingobium sp.]
MTIQRCLIAGLLVALPQAAAADSLGGGGDGFTVSPWRVVAALTLCLALGAAAILVLRKHHALGSALPRGPGERRMRVIEQQSLGPQRSLALVEIDGQSYAALVAPGAAALVLLGGSRDGAAAPAGSAGPA